MRSEVRVRKLPKLPPIQQPKLEKCRKQKMEVYFDSGIKQVEIGGKVTIIFVASFQKTRIC